MKKCKAPFLLIAFFSMQSFFTHGATVDTLSVSSVSMNKTYKAHVVLPESYGENDHPYPVLYLLHGGNGHYSDWLSLPPDKMLVKNLADRYHLIVVMPEGEVASWYMDSPVNKESQFETYITKEVISKIDVTYRTVKEPNGRVISGLSMGGHGALYLSARNPDLFCAAGSMSGALDLDSKNWKLPPEIAKGFKNHLKETVKQVLGTDDLTSEIVVENSVVNMADKMRKNGLKIIFDCGVDDFLIEVNRDLHQRLIENGTLHDYSERPGVHEWGYWQNSLAYHMLFFYNILKKNNVIPASE